MSYKNIFNSALIIITLLSGSLLLSSCSGLPVQGIVGGQTFETRVDSEVARYYLGTYLAGNRSDAALDERIDRVYQSSNGHLPDRNELKRLSDDFSVTSRRYTSRIDRSRARQSSLSERLRSSLQIRPQSFP